jgi:hypothetical protein
VVLFTEGDTCELVVIYSGAHEKLDIEVLDL